MSDNVGEKTPEKSPAKPKKLDQMALVYELAIRLENGDKVSFTNPFQSLLATPHLYALLTLHIAQLGRDCQSGRVGIWGLRPEMLAESEKETCSDERES